MRLWRNWQTRYFEGVVFTRRMGSSPIDRTILESGAVYRLFFFFSFGAEIFLADRFGWRLQIGAFLLFCLKSHQPHQKLSGHYVRFFCCLKFVLAF